VALRDELERKLLITGRFNRPVTPPAYLDGYHWRPAMVLTHARSGRPVAFELVRSPEALSRRILEEARKALEEHDDLAVVLLAHLDAAGGLGEYCRDNGFGLYVYFAETVSQMVPARCEAPLEVAPVARLSEGWIPRTIVEAALRLQAGRYRDLIAEALAVLGDPAAGLPKAVDAVRRAAEQVIARQEEYVAEPFDVYRMAVLEAIHRMQMPSSSEHVVHSFRLYVTGCVIIEHFWDFLCGSWVGGFSLPPEAMEDVWFLMSMFHDRGYIRDPERHRALEETVRMLGGELRPEPGLVSRLQSSEYQTGARAVAGFLEQVAQGFAGAPAHGAILGKKGEELARLLLGLYEQGTSHAITSSVDLAGETLQRVRAAVNHGAELNPQLLAARVFPAAAGIALHDWRVREQFADLGLFPFPAQRFPLAALLIYVDSWDHYRRKPDEPTPMTVVGLELSDDSCVAHVEWYDAREFAEKRVEYDSLRESLLWPAEMRLEVVVRNVGAEG